MRIPGLTWIPCLLAAASACEPSIDEAQLPERLAEAYCGSIAQCGCESGDPALGPDACVATQVDLFTPPPELAADATYDGDCAAQIEQRLQALGCDRELEEMPLCGLCHPYHGDAGAGDSCEWDGDCQQGLWCYGTCEDPCGNGDGARCLFTDDDIYYGERPCADGLVCDGTTELCRPPSQLGEPCSYQDCAAGLVCADGTCASAEQIAVSCQDHSDCPDDDAYCDSQAHVCRPEKAAGEPCEHNTECVTWCGDDGKCGAALCPHVEVAQPLPG